MLGPLRHGSLSQVTKGNEFKSCRYGLEVMSPRVRWSESWSWTRSLDTIYAPQCGDEVGGAVCTHRVGEKRLQYFANGVKVPVFFIFQVYRRQKRPKLFTQDLVSLFVCLVSRVF